MFRLGEENPWLCLTETDRNANFCIWVLEVDGLRVPPFEHHSEGNGILRAAGLNEGNWRSWVEEMTRLKDQHSYASQKLFVQTANDVCRDLLAKGGLPNNPQSEDARHYLQAHMQEFTQLLTQAQQTQPDLFFPKRMIPLDVWSGSPEGGKRLRELWEHYEPIAKQRLAWEQDVQTHHNGQTNLWQALSPYHTRLDSLMIHLVAYSQETVYLVPPRSIIMTIVDGDLKEEDFRTRTLQAAETLATGLSS
ncbi:MAG: hypothetical protein J2P36_26660 [Ktedonobacteraceae bacterium]|nr:hypothetical protein [Ktedonobacteraceae bacterium]